LIGLETVINFPFGGPAVEERPVQSRSRCLPCFEKCVRSRGTAALAYGGLQDVRSRGTAAAGGDYAFGFSMDAERAYRLRQENKEEPQERVAASAGT
jgi:hypothetical protein